MSEFTSLGLSANVLKALNDANYKTPTPIQAQAITPILEGRDLLGIAQTGTGKTGAFALPILELLARKAAKPIPGRVRVLVLTPTRELAAQVEASFKTYGRYTPMRSAVIFGGVGQDRQVKALDRGLDVLIATPGRLLDLMQQRHARLDQVEILVLDEADRMLDMGFIRDIKKITAAIPAKRQTLLFSATMPDAIAELAAEQLNDPVRVEVTPQATTVERIAQKLLFVDKSRKRDLLKHLLADTTIYQALVFTRTKRGADRVCEDLAAAGIGAGAIHGNKAQNHRERTLRSFRSGQLRVLVATDIAARGLDIPGVSHVFNYDLPDEPESYVHRIGRTARAGREGTAIAFCCSEELEQLRDIERIIGTELEVDAGHPFAIRLERMALRGRSSTPSSRADRFRRPQGGHQHQSRHHREGGEGRERSFSSPPSENLRSDFGEKRSQDAGGRRDRPRHEGERPSRPAGTGIGSRHESSPGARHEGPRAGGSRAAGGRRRGQGGPKRESGPSGAGPGAPGVLGGMFKAFKKRFGS
ncbi:MAG TPA: DEAD/DEAH box helicase [bacterium]|nr:DEAD/DEAH box helicase [bacterium]